MPAISHRIYLCPDIDGRPAHVFPFPEWWDRSELYARFESRSIPVPSLAYDDSALLLTYAEAAQIHEAGRRAFAADPRAERPYLREQMAQVAEALKDCRWVIVEAYEWESGLD